MDWTNAADPISAFDWVVNSISKTHAYDFYQGKRKFLALCLTQAVPLASQESKGNDAAKYIFKARILGENSPHSFLPDPCLLSEAGDAAGAINSIHQHTTFLGFGDRIAGTVENTINPGDLVEVELSKGLFSYNLQKGRYIRVVQAASSGSPILSAAGCANISITFGDLTPSGPPAPEIPGVFTVGPLPEGQYKVTSPYGPRALSGEMKLHPGVDYGAPTGTKVFAIGDGTVVKSIKGCKDPGFYGDRSCGGGFGNVVYIKHTTQTPAGEDIYSIYAHLNKNNMKVGDSVTAGDSIGTVGSSGSSTGPHLHLEIHIGKLFGKKVDPQAYLSDLPETRTSESVVEEEHESVASTFDPPPGVEGEDWEWVDEEEGTYVEFSTV